MMDWDRVRSAPASNDPASPVALEVCWRVRTPSNRVVTCGLFRDEAPGVEVRAFFTDDDLIRSQPNRGDRNRARDRRGVEAGGAGEGLCRDCGRRERGDVTGLFLSI